MPLFRRRPPQVTAHPPLREPSSSGPQPRRPRSRTQRDVRDALDRQLAICARVRTGEFDLFDVGVVVQVHHNQANSYDRWKAHWERRLASVPGRSLGTQLWPATLPEDALSVIVIPVKPGTTTVTAALPKRAVIKGVAGTPTRRERNLIPAMIGQPIAAHARTPKPGESELMGMDRIQGWLELGRADEAPRLAAPIFEYVLANGQQSVRREVVTWDLPWPLSAPNLPA
jgi:hypothetical protein